MLSLQEVKPPTMGLPDVTELVVKGVEYMQDPKTGPKVEVNIEGQLYAITLGNCGKKTPLVHRLESRG